MSDTRKTLRIPAGLAARIEAQRGEVSWSRFVLGVLDAHVEFPLHPDHVRLPDKEPAPPVPEAPKVRPGRVVPDFAAAALERQARLNRAKGL